MTNGQLFGYGKLTPLRALANLLTLKEHKDNFLKANKYDVGAVIVEWAVIAGVLGPNSLLDHALNKLVGAELYDVTDIFEIAKLVRTDVLNQHTHVLPQSWL